MRHLPLTIALLLVSAPVWAQTGGASIEKSLSSMQDGAEKSQAEVSPPASEAMQEKAEKFIKDLASKDAALGDGSPAKSEPEAKGDERSPSPPAPQSSGSSPQIVGGGMSGSSSRPVAASPSKSSSDVGSGSVADMIDKNTLDPTPPGGKMEPDPQGDTILPRNRKSKSAGLRTGESKKGGAQQGDVSQTVAAKPVRRIPGFVELN